jgi:thiol-disulfide isomerase/thioredoxin
MPIGKMNREGMMANRRLNGLVLAVCALVYSATALSGPDARAQAAAPSKPMPALALVDLSGYQQFLAKYRGKPVLVTFWATWCEPCRDEYPMIVKLAAQYAPQGLAVFGVDMDDDADLHLVQHFLTQNRPGFPNIRQKPGIDLDAFYRGVNPEWQGTMPETVFYGRNGRIVVHFVGEKTRNDFDNAIHLILATPSADASRNLLPSGN